MGSLAATAGAAHEHLDALHAVLLGAAGGRLAGELGGEGRALARTLEARLASGGLRHHVPVRIGHG